MYNYPRGCSILSRIKFKLSFSLNQTLDHDRDSETTTINRRLHNQNFFTKNREPLSNSEAKRCPKNSAQSLARLPEIGRAIAAESPSPNAQSLPRKVAPCAHLLSIPRTTSCTLPTFLYARLRPRRPSVAAEICAHPAELGRALPVERCRVTTSPGCAFLSRSAPYRCQVTCEIQQTPCAHVSHTLPKADRSVPVKYKVFSYLVSSDLHF